MVLCVSDFACDSHDKILMLKTIKPIIHDDQVRVIVKGNKEAV